MHLSSRAMRIEEAVNIADLRRPLADTVQRVGVQVKALAATRRTIDEAMRATIFPMGPFELGDQAGAVSSIERGLQRDPRDATLLGLQRRLRAPGVCVWGARRWIAVSY